MALLVHKNPATALPDEEYQTGYLICEDEAVRPGVVIVVDTDTYLRWQDGSWYVFARRADGTIVHIREEECRPLEAAST
jgi:hypothetical protein